MLMCHYMNVYILLQLTKKVTATYNDHVFCAIYCFDCFAAAVCPILSLISHF